MSDLSWRVILFLPLQASNKERIVNFRLLIILIFLTACSSSDHDVAKSFEISAVRLAEIKSNPYTPGNGPGGFAAARLSGLEDDPQPESIQFLGFGPYLHEFGFSSGMTIIAIDGVSVTEIFADRWKPLRLQDPGAFDAAHYKDMVEYIFDKQPGEYVVISVDMNESNIDNLSVNESTVTLKTGTRKVATENWQLNFLR